MNRLVLLVAAVLLSGCGDGDPVANDPMLQLKVKRGNNEPIGRYRVSRTGVIDETGEIGPDGAGTSETVTIEKIADDGVTLTIKILDADGGESSKQILVPYDKEISAAVSKDATAMARSERKNDSSTSVAPESRAAQVLQAGRGKRLRFLDYLDL